MPRSASALASRLARSSSSLNVSRRAVDADPLCACDTTTSRSGTASQTRSKRSARLNQLTARIYDGLSETLSWELQQLATGRWPFPSSTRVQNVTLLTFLV